MQFIDLVQNEIIKHNDHVIAILNNINMSLIDLIAFRYWLRKVSREKYDNNKFSTNSYQNQN